jgi:hypothetical protein
MAESIGNLYSTAIPSLSDTADIQEALRVYHYGAASGSGVGEYPITNTDPTNLVIPSVAYHLFNLQNQIDNFEFGILPSAWTQKGVLLVGSVTAGDVIAPRPLNPGPNGQVLTTNSATNTGLEWRVPDVTLINTVTVSNKTFVNATIPDSGIKFSSSGTAFTTTLSTLSLTGNRIINLPNASTTLVGTDTVQTLTNKIINAVQITGILETANGGTGASTVSNARTNLEIFNSQTSVTPGNDRTPYSGKIYVADPAVVGSSGANLDGAIAGDLWFW